MDHQPKILAFAGSGRRYSLNRKLLDVAVTGAEQAGAEVTLLDLNAYPMPIYDGDIETSEGVPENVLKVRKLMLEHRGFLIASPEYNRSVTPLLKNLIDWTSRPVNGEDGLAPYRNRIAVLMSASPGSYGGASGLDHLRAILQHTGVIVLPNQIMLGKADESLRDEARCTAIHRAGAALVRALGSPLGAALVEDPFDRRHDMGRIGNASRF